MPTTLTPAQSPAPVEKRPERRPAEGGGEFGGRGGSRPGGGGGGGRGGPDPSARAVQRYKLGTWIGLGGIVMLFAAFTSAMVVRRGLSDDWQPLDLPNILWLSTTVLLISSITLEKARRAMRGRLDGTLRRWLGVTGLLGGAFLVSQFFGWRALGERGIYLASNPSSSFFYLLTAVHAVHLLGGVLALSYLMFRIWRPSIWVTREAVMESTAIYWHFMDGLWVYLVLLLFFWR